MKKINVFNGSKAINKIVAEALNYQITDEQIDYGWFTKDIFLSTFFYLSKRFGQPQYFDDGKEAGAWHFIVKQYEISVHLNSSWVTFIVYGDKNRFGKIFLTSPCRMRERREWKKKADQLIDPYSDEYTEKELVILNGLWQPFLEENGLNGISQEEIFKNYDNQMKWDKVIRQYNNKITGVNWKDFRAKYGEEYENADTRHAKRVLIQFLKNMLTPIYIRDIPYNLKGKISDKQAFDFYRYENNIKIEVDKRFTNDSE